MTDGNRGHVSFEGTPFNPGGRSTLAFGDVEAMEEASANSGSTVANNTGSSRGPPPGFGLGGTTQPAGLVRGAAGAGGSPFASRGPPPGFGFRGAAPPAGFVRGAAGAGRGPPPGFAG